MELIGNNQNIKFLSKLLNTLREDSVFHSGSFVLSGPENIGKKTFLIEFIKSLVCEKKDNIFNACDKCSACKKFANNAWTDFNRIKREEGKRNISVNQIRKMINQASMSSFSSGYKFFLIEEADNLSEEGFNSLLKTMEEPNNKTFIFLTTSKIENVSKTIISRCQILNFYPVKRDLIYDFLVKKSDDRFLSKKIANLCGGRPGLAVKYLNDKQLMEEDLSLADCFLKILNVNIIFRFPELEKIVSGKIKESDMFFLTVKIIDSWQAILRDVFLVKLGKSDLLRYSSLSDEVNSMASKIEFSKILEIFNFLDKSKRDLFSNASPKLTLDNILINI
jgi:DNA polymerase-3 subunit delta'